MKGGGAGLETVTYSLRGAAETRKHAFCRHVCLLTSTLDPSVFLK